MGREEKEWKGVAGKEEDSALLTIMRVYKLYLLIILLKKSGNNERGEDGRCATFYVTLDTTTVIKLGEKEMGREDGGTSLADYMVWGRPLRGSETVPQEDCKQSHL